MAASRSPLVVVASLSAALALSTGACAEPPPSLVILQNQQATFDDTTSVCTASADVGAARLSGVFDIDLDRSYPYYVYPLAQNRLPSVMTSGGVERNSVTLRSVRVEVQSPPGVDAGWPAGCPGTFDWPASAVLDPEQSRSLAAQGFQTCHAQRLRELAQAGAIPVDQSQPVFFTLKLSLIADRNGSELQSDVFPFQVQVCAGCLQEQYPLTPTCADAPKPNPYRGNGCNIAQDYGPVLCCTDQQGTLVCPAPDA